MVLEPARVCSLCGGASLGLLAGDSVGVVVALSWGVLVVDEVVALLEIESSMRWNFRFVVLKAYDM